ncbi:MAG: MBL fold metallo-hydrolase [Candidatus Omnitrophica bacterium]|jgi:glyoxylase-like metal-dependent hydrolase (beta-lactamase superfamily II)|nr:MBL fold metallo-hydrolase [Candidatus Omnitrophota bacterium]
MIFKTICVGPMQVNCYVLACAENSPALIIDPGDEYDLIKAVIDRYKLKPALVINTHGHYDHIGCDNNFDLPVYVHSGDKTMLEQAELNLSAFFSEPLKVNSEIRLLKDKQLIKLDCIELEVLHTPGHTTGGISLLMKKPERNILFTGDTLFCQSVGRTDMPGGNQPALKKSIQEKLMVLPDDLIIYPGHGKPSTIGEERMHNPFLS